MQGRAPNWPTGSPAQPNRDGNNDSLTVALISAMIAAFDIQLGMQPVQRISKPATIIKPSGILGARRHGLRTLNCPVNAIDIPPSNPCVLANCARRKQLAARRNAALIKTNAKNSVGAPFAKMPGHIDDAVHTYRLQSSARAGQSLILDHAGPQAQVIVHVFRVHSEHAAEVHPTAGYAMICIARKSADIAAPDPKSAANIQVKTIKVRLCRRGFNQPAKNN